ncbi:MAG TPA: putative sulfate exporter family transporter [Gemmatimonadaceae bacterium]|jgi:uncharacterized integral membrane protein (TIGR00698 family)
MTSGISLQRVLPGVALCIAISLAATVAGTAEHALLGRAWIEPLVLSILIGAAVRTAWTPTVRWKPGIDLSAKQLLEIAIVLLGLTLDVPLLLRAGPVLALGIVVAVGAALGVGYTLGRALGLRRKLALLVGVGNAICGNSAIAAVAPVIDAEPGDVASSIAFTAVLGVVVVLTLPHLMGVLSLSEYQYGIIAGLTVYAVPQVLAATLPVSTLSGQVGTLVKLTRVLMLGPIVLGLSVAMRRRGRQPRARIAVGRLVPWFIVGFLLLAGVRATGVVPIAIVDVARTVSGALTVLAMAALGLGVDVRALGKVGGAVTATATGALLLLLAISIGLVKGLGIR